MFTQELIEKPYLDEVDEPVYSITEPAIIVRVLECMGVSANAVLDGTGIRPSALGDPLSRVSASQRMRIYRNARRLSTDPAFGLLVGHNAHLSSYGIYGFGLISSATLASAIEFAFKYMKLGGPLMEKQARVVRDKVEFRAVDTLGLDDLFPLALEIWFSSVLAMAQDALGSDFAISQLELAYPEPPHAQRYRDVFGEKVSFSAPANRFCFDASYLSTPLVQSSDLSRKLCESICDKLLAEFESHTSVAQKLRHTMLMAPGQILSLDECARKLRIAPRTLRRKLKERGTSFREIRRDVRQALAIEYLCNTRLTTAEIAERIGFSDSANFRNAFKRWTHESPTQYRSKFANASADAAIAELWNPVVLRPQ